VTGPQIESTPAGAGELPIIVGINELRVHAGRLGLIWHLRPATVMSTNIIVFDGDTQPISAVSMIGPLYVGARVMVIIVPPDGNFIVGFSASVLRPGMIVGQYIQLTEQTTVTTIWEPLTLDGVDLFDLIQAHDSSVNPSRFTPSIPGWYGFEGSVAFRAGATGRRGTRWLKNGTAEVGTELLQFAGIASGISFPAKSWGIYLNGQGDYVELDIMQESGGNLDTFVSGNAASHMKVTYLGSVQSTL
jgi:hypothetical protein